MVRKIKQNTDNTEEKVRLKLKHKWKDIAGSKRVSKKRKKLVFVAGKRKEKAEIHLNKRERMSKAKTEWTRMTSYVIRDGGKVGKIFEAGNRKPNAEVHQNKRRKSKVKTGTKKKLTGIKQGTRKREKKMGCKI